MEKRGPNRLIHEASPYLQQHAHNPVDWYPWGPEALQKARDENKPIFLSIGYSACHWCHVGNSTRYTLPVALGMRMVSQSSLPSRKQSPGEPPGDCLMIDYAIL